MDKRQIKPLKAYFRVWVAMLIREMAAATGRAEAARHYAEEEAKLRKAFAAAYMGADGTIRDEYKGQCNDLYMLKLGLCGSPAAVEATKRDLVENIKSHGDRLQTGFLGTAILLPTLTFKANAVVGSPDEPTAISFVRAEYEDGKWYTTNGLQLQNKPTRKGVYIFNGRKVVIK